MKKNILPALLVIYNLQVRTMTQNMPGNLLQNENDLLNAKNLCNRLTKDGKIINCISKQ